MHVVISRYDEDVQWVDFLQYNYTIYNKGETDISYPFIKRTNIGRESETFISYIIENYNNLSKNTVFLQGNPFNHMPDVINTIHLPVHAPLTPLSDQFKTDDLFGRPCHPGLPIQRYISDYMPEITDTHFKFATGAQYIVSHKLILNKPIEWWKILRDSHFKYDDAPWILERMWPYIYSLTF